MSVGLRRFAPSLVAATALLLGGCGGGGSTPSVVQNALPQTQQTANVTFAIVIPPASGTSASAKRGPLYVSSSTASATVAVTPSGGSAGVPATIGCTSSSCSGTLSAPVGSDAFVVRLYDGMGGSGNLLSTGTLQQTIVANQANSVNVTFDGVVASLAISLNPASILPGTSGSASVSVNALDADGNVIVGPGVYADASGAPVTVDLANSDTSGDSSLSVSSLTQPTTGITLRYTTALAASPTITASATGVTSAHASLQFLAPTLTTLGTATGLIGTSVSETLTGTNFADGAGVSVSGSGVTVSDITVNSSTSLTATFFVDAEAATGSRDVTVTTPGGTSSAQPFGISNTGVDVVTLATDTAAGTPAGTGAGAAGDLRHALLNAVAGDTIVFDTTAMCASTSCTITLAGPLPPIAQNQTVDGGYAGRVMVDGASAHRVFWIDGGTVTLANLQIQHANATGGAGGDEGGGGGAGLGAGLFVHGGAVTILNDAFVDDAAIGGSGNGDGNIGGGGGGLGGNGGADDGHIGNAGGGGGVLGGGSDGGASSGGTGGVGFSGIGGGSGGAYGGIGGSGGIGASGAGGGGGAAPNGSGGGGGFGGGGGGSFEDSGGGGGFGGGGGGSGGIGGAGGAGGGGGSGGIGGAGGALATVSGGAGGGFGGGGAAAGPAVFVDAGALTTTNSRASGCTATGGAVGGGSATAGTADATPVFNYTGTVNGSTTAGPVSSALST